MFESTCSRFYSWGFGRLSKAPWEAPMVQEVKNRPANAGDAGSIPESGRFPGGGHGNPLQGCLENPMDRGA